MKIALSIFLVYFVNITVSYSQKNKDIVMPMGNGIYTISKTGGGLTSLGKLRTEAYEIANKYAKNNNSVAEIISVNETPMSFGVHPNVDLRFRLVTNSKKIADSTTNSLTISSAYSSNGKLTDTQIILNKSKQTSLEKLEKLEKLGKLYKDGLLTKDEFEFEKKKILSDN
jgi:hypothetical protein